MLPELRSRLIVVLVRARNPSNIGAVARAMHDFGFSQLRIVNDYPAPFVAALVNEAVDNAAAKAAVHASSVLAAATEHSNLADAIADCTLVLGTTAVGSRKLDHPLHTLRAAVPLVYATLETDVPEAASSPRVALLFGSEKTGLSNDDLSLCHALLTIPMNDGAGRHLSMNLGQAAAVCLYSLSQLASVPCAPGSGAPHLASEMWDSESSPATSADLDRLTTILQNVLERSGYARRHPANVRPAVLRRLVRRMSNTPADAAVWCGILRQLLHALGQPLTS